MSMTALTYLNYTVGIRVLVLLSHHDMYDSCRFVNMDRVSAEHIQHLCGPT